MKSPIKYIINTLPTIKIYIEDFPKYFNTRFIRNFQIKLNSRINLSMKSFIKKNISIITNITTNIGCSLRLKKQFQIIPKITTKLNHRLFIKEKISIIPKIYLNLIVHVYQRLDLRSTICIVTNFKTNIIQRFKSLKVFRVNVKMKVKSIVALFYKNYERGDLTFEEIFNDEELNTWQKLLWKEIK